MTSTLPPLTQALTGALGSASANVLTYPLDLLVARQQTTRDARIARSGLTGTRRLARAVLRRDGWRALYAGIGADTAGTLLSKCVSLPPHVSYDSDQLPNPASVTFTRTPSSVRSCSADAHARR